MWLYVRNDVSEYSYAMEDSNQKLFLKDISLYYDGSVDKKNGFEIFKAQDGEVLYKFGKYSHTKLKPSYWKLSFFLCVLGVLSYLILTKF